MPQQICKTTLALPVVFLFSACSPELPEPVALPKQSTFVGSEQCINCHQAEFEQWQGSHHQLAMQEADSSSVLGDFSGVVVPYFDTQTTFFQRDGRYFVRIQNAAGKNEEYEITYTFGVAPLQQYLVATEGGRQQALQFLWDARAESDGGQRWYHLYPDEYIGPDDQLHWTGRYFNWNGMCAECHSTNVQLGYDIDTDSFDTSYDEISVGCEACHGPASRHVIQARQASFDENYGLPVNLDDRGASVWVMNATTGIAERSGPNARHQQPESCGRCHARRRVIASNYEYGVPLTDTHMPSLLDEGLYHADGRILDEVYVYGSFVQSKMYAAGVTCTDCHNPHSGELHAGSNPNDICAQCHMPAKFASPNHSKQQVGDCVSCHMQAKTYMGIDDRRDHSFRLPQAGQSEGHYGAIIAAGRTGGANAKLAAGIGNSTFPAIARATMLTLLEPLQDTAAETTLLDQLNDPDPLIRIAALRALRQQPAELAMRSGSHLLFDPVLGVRIEAAATYAGYRDILPFEAARAFTAAADEFRESLRTSSFMPSDTLRLAQFESAMGRDDIAARLYEYSNRRGPNIAAVQYSYALHLVRSGEHARALTHLQRAADLEPENRQFVYTYGVALNSLGDSERALGVLRKARRQFPDDLDIGWALATIHRDRGEVRAALDVAERLMQEHSSDPRVPLLLEQLKSVPENRK